MCKHVFKCAFQTKKSHNISRENQAKNQNAILHAAAEITWSQFALHNTFTY